MPPPVVNHRFPGPLPGRMTLGMPRRLPIQAAQSRTGAPSARPTTTLRYSCVATTDTPRVVSLCEGTRGPPRFCHSTTRWPQLTHLGTKLRPRSGCPAQLSLPLQVAGCPARVVPSLGPSSSRSLLNRRKGANRGFAPVGLNTPSTCLIKSRGYLPPGIPGKEPRLLRMPSCRASILRD